MGAASQELTERAKLLISERRYQEAVRACRRALLSRPDDVDVRLLLGEALLALERFDEVRVEMIALARKAPLRGEVHRLLGEAYLRDHRPNQAVEALRRALELDAGDEIARELLSEAADENAPVSTTIERWFADEAEPTVETDSPEWEEEHTGPVRMSLPPATAPTRSRPPEPLVQIDPSLALPAPPAFPRDAAAVASPLGEHDLLAPLDPPTPRPAPKPTPAPRPRVRSRKPTVAGFAADPFAPPPRTAPKFSSPADEPEEATLASRPSLLGRDKSAAPGGPLLAPPSPQTEELDLIEELADSDAELMTQELTAEGKDALPGVPTRAGGRAPRPAAPPGPIFELEDFAVVADGAPPPDFDDAGATEAFQRSPSARPPAGIEELEPPTLAHFPSPDQVAEPLTFPPAELGPPPESPRYEPAFEPEPGQVSPRSAPPGPASPRPASPRQAPAPTERPPPAKRAKGSQTARVRPEKRRWVLPAAAALGALVLVGTVTALLLWVWLDRNAVAEIRAEAAIAGDSGARADLEAVLTRLEGSDEPELLALQTRIRATLVLEHDADLRPAVESSLGQLPVQRTEWPTDATIAAALMAIDSGEASNAVLMLSRVPAEGEQINEGLRARALALYSGGRWQEALAAAATVGQAEPTSPRHVALHALTRHAAGQPAEPILTELRGFAGRTRQPAIRVALARIELDAGGDPDSAVAEASAVIDELGDVASPYELSWAHLIRARHAVDTGRTADALVDARAAREHVPLWDSQFGDQLVAALLAAGAPQEAQEQLEALRPVMDPAPVEGQPRPPSRVAARARLRARVLLALQDLDGADTALASAGEGTEASLLRAQVLEARGSVDQARPLYERAMEDPGPAGRMARVRLAAIAMAAGGPERTIELLEPVRETAPEPEVAPLLARAYVARDRLDDADTLLDAALRRRPGAPDLLGVRGSIHLRRGNVAEAVTSLSTAVEARPNDPELQSDLGDAARQAGDAARSTTAYEAALAESANHPRALVGLALLALDGGDLDAAMQRLDALDASDTQRLDVARTRGRVFVARGDGALGAEALSAIARSLNDAQLWTLLGHLESQAEKDRDASRWYDRALALDEDRPDALLGQSLIQVRLGSTSRAVSLISQAERSAASRGEAERFAAPILVARGRVQFEEGNLSRAAELAGEALSADSDLATAHLVVANVAIEQGSSPLESLRAAVSGRAPPPEALGRLAARLERGEEACQLAARYMQVAPRGFDHEDVERVQARCR